MFKVILKHAPKYFTGTIISSGLSLLMTKYYTWVFSPKEFGILSLYLVMFKYITSLVSLNLDSGSTRLYFDYRKNHRDEYLSTIFWFITTNAIIVFIVGVLFIKPISNWIAPNSEKIYLITILAGILAVYVSFFIRILYNEHKSTAVLKHTLFQTFVNHFSSVIFISIFNLGIFGRISGQALGYGLNIFTLIREFTKENFFRIKIIFNKAMAKETFLLTLPSMISMLLGVAFVYADRFFLKYFIGDVSVGIYTLGYMLGQGLSMVYEAVAQALLPKVYNDMNKNYEKAKKELEHFSYIYYIILTLITIIISIFSSLIVRAFSNENYLQSALVMPFVMAGFMMGGFYKIPSLILGYHKIVWFYPLLSVISFGANVFFNWWFIPKYSIIGSAFASFLGLFIYSSFLQLFSKKFMSKKYNLFTFLIYICIFLVVTIFFYIIGE